MTLSCAEYHWPDIRRLLEDRKNHYPEPEGTTEEKDIVREVDDLSIVVQEYFQLRVEQFLATVGRDILGIEHYWLRYEFAPSRGQVHAHLLAIANPEVRDFFRHLHEYQDDPDKQAEMLQEWSNDLMRYTADVDPSIVTDENISKTNNPCQRRFSETTDMNKDCNELLTFTQMHVCSDRYCMRQKNAKG
jgi:hypothetical protein